MARAIVVDDSLLMRKVLEDCLVKLGHDVVAQAENAKEAVDAYREHQPDFVTMDVTMPVVDDVTTQKAVTDILGIDAQARIVLITAVHEGASIVEFMQLGAKEVLNKPFTPDSVAEVIARIL